MPKEWEQQAKKLIKSITNHSNKQVKPFEPHDFKDYPELTNNQLVLHGHASPHKQHLNDFDGVCVQVHDGDTIKVQWQERNFPTKIRFINFAAAEIGEGGEKSRDWLRERLLNKWVTVKLNPKKRTGKYGRILGQIFVNGQDVAYESAMYGNGEVIE